MLSIIKSIIAKWVDYAMGIAIASAFGLVVGTINYILQNPLSNSSSDALNSTYETLRATANMMDAIGKSLDIIGLFSFFIFIINLPFAIEKRLRDGKWF